MEHSMSWDVDVKRKSVTAKILLLLLLLPRVGAAVSAQSLEDVKVRAADVLDIVVLDQPDLSKKYSVEADGTVMFPLLGTLEAADKTPSELTRELENRLLQF